MVQNPSSLHHSWLRLHFDIGYFVTIQLDRDMTGAGSTERNAVHLSEMVYRLDALKGIVKIALYLHDPRGRKAPLYRAWFSFLGTVP
jgi:hypothetical protein